MYKDDSSGIVEIMGSNNTGNISFIDNDYRLIIALLYLLQIMKLILMIMLSGNNSNWYQ